MAFLYLCYIAAGMIAMVYYKRLPPRIGNPTLLMCSVLFLCMDQLAASYGRRWRLRGLTGAVTGVCAVALLSVAGFRAVKLRRIVAEYGPYTEGFDRTLAAVERRYRGKVLFFQPGLGLHYELSNPLRPLRHGFHSIPTGWPIYSPRFFKALAALGLERASDLYPYLTDNPDAFVVFHPKMIDLLVTFIGQTYGTDCVARRVEQLPIGSVVYQLVSRAPAN